MRIMMTASHGGYDPEQKPIGGGAAVCERLAREWAGRSDLSLTIVDGTHLGDIIPSSLGEFAYARFCRDFERLSTKLALDQRPDVVLCHDVSEGPDFEQLARAGIPCVTIFHVDVVSFFCRFYLFGLSPTLANKAWRCLRALPWPDVLRLVFDKQDAAVRFSSRIVLPSPGMVDEISACYRFVSQIDVIPWGAPNVVPAPRKTNHAPVILVLSRLSPEKGHELLFDAIEEGEKRDEIPPGLEIVTCGEPAFMRGPAYAARLKRRAARLRRCTVRFVGHVGGAEKAAHFARADLFVAPSLYESYGLSVIEAMAYGTPVVARRTFGTECVLAGGGGRLIEPGPGEAQRFWAAIRELLKDDETRSRLAAEARANATQHPFSVAADRLLGVLRQAGDLNRSRVAPPPGTRWNASTING